MPISMADRGPDALELGHAFAARGYRPASHLGTVIGEEHAQTALLLHGNAAIDVGVVEYLETDGHAMLRKLACGIFAVGRAIIVSQAMGAVALHVRVASALIPTCHANHLANIVFPH